MKHSLLTRWLSVVLTVIAHQLPAQSIEDFSKLPDVKWKFKAGPIFGSPVISGNTVYITSQDSSLHALDLQKGQSKWNFSTNGAMRSTPFVNGDNVYIISEDAQLYKVNNTSGKLVWRYITPQGTLGERKYDRADYFQSSPIVHNGTVYFGMGDYLYAVAEETGRLNWSFKTGNLVHTKPAIAGDKIIIGSYDGYVYSLNNLTGSLLWKFKSVGQRFFPNGEMMGDPVISRNTVFIGSRDYNFYAIDLVSGYCYWNKQFPRGWALPSTVLKDSVLYLGTSDDYLLLALNPRTGSELWRAQLKFNVFGRMALSRSMGYVGTLNGKLFGIDLKTGAIKWVFEGDGFKTNRKQYFNEADAYLETALAKLGNFDEVLKMYNRLGSIFTAPAVSSDHIVIAGADGMVYCLGR